MLRHPATPGKDECGHKVALQHWQSDFPRSPPPTPPVWSEGGITASVSACPGTDSHQELWSGWNCLPKRNMVLSVNETQEKSLSSKICRKESLISVRNISCQSYRMREWLKETDIFQVIFHASHVVFLPNFKLFPYFKYSNCLFQKIMKKKTKITYSKIATNKIWHIIF